MMAVLSVLGAILLWVLKALLWLLLILLLVLVLALVCPFCADVSWQGSQTDAEDEAGTLQIKAGVCGITFPVLQWPKPEQEAAAGQEPPKGVWGRLKARLRAARETRKAARAAKKPAKPQTPKQPRKKAKLTVNVVCAILRGAGRLMGAVFGALRLTKIRVCLAVRGSDAAAVGRSYGKANAWLYASLGFLDHFLYLDFEELRLEPAFPDRTEPIDEHISLRISARLLFIVIAAVRVFIELWREKVLDIFL
jgi:hypothetical protein